MSVIPSRSIVYFPDFSPKLLQRIIADQRESIPCVQLFLLHYKTFPCLLNCTQAQVHAFFHIPSILNYLKTHFEHDSSNDITTQHYHVKSKQYFVFDRLCHLGNGMMVFIKNSTIISDVENSHQLSSNDDDYFLGTKTIQIYHLRDHDTEAANMSKEFFQMILLQSQSLQLSFVCRTLHGGYRFRNIRVKQSVISDLALHYGEKFVKIHERILKELNNKEGKGIVLLHGIAGCGKTHYIRYLIEHIKEKKLVYIPPNLANNLTQPDFLAFLLRHKNSILVIEDAENIIRDRNEAIINASQAVANLLNLSDGLLGDAMHMQIIATFNCDLTVIDQALLRPGRLIANYEFGKLDVNPARILSEKLGFGMEHITMPMSLAEIYNQNTEDEIA